MKGAFACGGCFASNLGFTPRLHMAFLARRLYICKLINYTRLLFH